MWQSLASSYSIHVCVCVCVCLLLQYSDTKNPSEFLDEIQMYKEPCLCKQTLFT
jgi:hypothetical protein